MDWDEKPVKAPKPAVIGEDLSRMSAEDLQGRLDALHAEIARVAAQIRDKQAVKAAAASIFGEDD